MQDQRSPVAFAHNSPYVTTCQRLNQQQHQQQHQAMILTKNELESYDTVPANSINDTSMQLAIEQQQQQHIQHFEYYSPPASITSSPSSMQQCLNQHMQIANNQHFVTPQNSPLNTHHQDMMQQTQLCIRNQSHHQHNHSQHHQHQNHQQHCHANQMQVETQFNYQNQLYHCLPATNVSIIDTNDSANDYSSIYSYDIDDKFSDILSVPSSPISNSDFDDDSFYQVSSVGSSINSVTFDTAQNLNSPQNNYATVPRNTTNFLLNNDDKQANNNITKTNYCSINTNRANMGINNAVNINSHSKQRPRSSPIHLWEFLKELLQEVDGENQMQESDIILSRQQLNEQTAAATIIRWLDKTKGVFKIEDSVRVAKLWGKRKNKPKMNYDKLSRSIRQYYKKGIMKKTDRSQRLVYQFCAAYCH